MISNIEEVLRKIVLGFLPDRDRAPVGSMHVIWNHAGILAVTNLNHTCYTISEKRGRYSYLYVVNRFGHLRSFYKRHFLNCDPGIIAEMPVRNCWFL